MKKRTLSLLLALVMIIGLLPVTAQAGELGNGLQYEVYADHVEITGYTGDAADVVIPAEIAGLPVTAIGNDVFILHSELASVSIPDSITNIGCNAFAGCSSLTNISIPDSVTNIGYNAFSECTSLTNISIPNGIIEISDGTFNNCTNLISISIPNSVTRIGYDAFNGCSSLTSISIPDSITDISDYAFSNCSSLTSISIPDGITHISSEIFSWCSSLTYIAIPNSITSIGDYAFNGCSSLTNISIPNSVTSIGDGAFEGCSNITSIPIPNGITTIGARTFYGCSRLSSISIPDSVTQIGGGAFFGCSNLTNITIPDGVNDIGDYTFGNCYNLTNITIPNGVTYIGDSTFENCTNLTSISIPNSVTHINRFAFNGCTSLSNISLPGNVTNIGLAAFQGCSSLTSISIPDSVIHIDDSAFNSCANMVEIVVDKNNPNYSSDNRGVLFDKSKTKLIRAPGAIADTYTIPGSVTYISDSAFSRCSNITGISISDSVEHIGGFAFLLCTNLSSIRFLGDAPEMDNGAYGIFADTTATAYYPADNVTWTVDVMQNYGGNITWVPYNPNNPFTDVPVDSFYEEPVLWALENGITSGATETEFAPEDTCQRAQVVTFLWRAAGKPKAKSAVNPFVDVKPGKYYYDAVLWAVEQGITTGMDDTHFEPYGICNRSQVVTFLYRAFKEPPVKNADNPFTDVPAGKWYTAPVLWAVQEGITNGLSATEFGPDDFCKRSQVVTFLYRAYN